MHSSAPFGVGCLLKRKEKEERKRKTYVIKFSSCGSFQELPPMQNQRKLHNFA
jgi:hypothetical protein